MGQPTSRYPLTSRQRDPSGAARASDDVLALTLRIRGILRTECLQGALEDVVERHEALRTRIHYDEADGNRGFQEVLPPMPVPLAVHDVPAEPGRTRDDIAVGLCNTLRTEELAYSVTPSMRATLHRFDDRDAVLTLLVHHLYIDGWSAGLLHREIAVCYRARVNGTPHALPAPTPYREFAAWEQEFLQGDRGAAARRFWTEKLAGAELCALPADRPHGPDSRLAQCAVGNFSIDRDDFATVVAGAAQHRCSVWHLFLAAVMALTEKLTGRTDITVLTVSSGRPGRAFYETIGFFADLVPVRLQFGDATTFRDLLLVARKASADALAHQIPIAMILEMFPELLKMVADPQVLVPGFNYITAPAPENDTNLAISIDQVFPPEESPGDFNRGAFKWNFQVVTAGEFRCAVEYEPDAVDAGTIQRWGSDFIDLVRAIADDPDRPWKNS